MKPTKNMICALGADEYRHLKDCRSFAISVRTLISKKAVNDAQAE